MGISSGWRGGRQRVGRECGSRRRQRVGGGQQWVAGGWQGVAGKQQDAGGWQQRGRCRCDQLRER